MAGATAAKAATTGPAAAMVTAAKAATRAATAARVAPEAAITVMPGLIRVTALAVAGAEAAAAPKEMLAAVHPAQAAVAPRPAGAEAAGAAEAGEPAVMAQEAEAEAEAAWPASPTAVGAAVGAARRGHARHLEAPMLILARVPVRPETRQPIPRPSVANPAATQAVLVLPESLGSPRQNP